MGASKEPIKLRRRKTPTGNITLYLDIYLNGNRSYEYLKLYLIPEKTKTNKDKNRQTLQLAEAVKAICGYLKLEKMKFVQTLNHFAMKAKIYQVALAAAFKEIGRMKEECALA